MKRCGKSGNCNESEEVEKNMKQVKIIKKKDDYTMEYEVGDICKVTGTWYGGVQDRYSCIH